MWVGCRSVCPRILSNQWVFVFLAPIWPVRVYERRHVGRRPRRICISAGEFTADDYYVIQQLITVLHYKSVLDSAFCFVRGTSEEQGVPHAGAVKKLFFRGRKMK